MPKPPRIAIYVRVSTLKIEQEHGLISQERACRSFIESKEWKDAEVKVYVDKVSGRKAERPQLKQLLHDAGMNHLQAVVTFRLDRLTRCGIGELLDVYRQFKKYHVKVYSVEEKHIDPDGDPLLVEFFLSGLAFAAAIESRAIGERVASGIATKRLEAAQRGEDFVWGKAHKSKLRADPSIPWSIAALRDSGFSWSECASVFKVGRTTARKLCLLGQGRNLSEVREYGAGVKAANGISSD